MDNNFKMRVMMAVMAVVITLAVPEANADSKNESSVSWWKRTFGKLTWNEVIQTSETREDVVGYVSGSVVYKADDGDQWAGGKETWERGYGDCEDIAAVTVDICKAKGWDAWIEIFAPKKSLSGHAVAVGMTDGKYWFFCGSYREADSMDEVRQIVARSMKWDVKGVSSVKVTDKSQVGATLVASK